jgi:hypothetical protein
MDNFFNPLQAMSPLGGTLESDHPQSDNRKQPLLRAPTTRQPFRLKAIDRNGSGSSGGSSSRQR